MIVFFAISAIEPASSTPVGPPPIITNVKYRFFFAGSVSFSASSREFISFSRIKRASFKVFNPGAYFYQSSFPKYECLEPVAIIK